MDFCPVFWDWLIEKHGEGDLFSTETVKSELKAADDELADWVNKLDTSFFLSPDKTISPALQQVSAWAESKDYEPQAINTFLQAADCYLVSQALSGKHIVVTHEVFSNSKKKIKIPNACIDLDIKYTNTFEMLRREKARFIK